jgi:hypothetical protein
VFWGAAVGKRIFTAETRRRGGKQTSKSNPESAEGAEAAEASGLGSRRRVGFGPASWLRRAGIFTPGTQCAEKAEAAEASGFGSRRPWGKTIFTAETRRRGGRQASESNPESAEGAEAAEAPGLGSWRRVRLGPASSLRRAKTNGPLRGGITTRLPPPERRVRVRNLHG